MKNFESCVNLKVLLQKALAAIPKLEEKIRSAEKAQPDLDSEAVKAKALEMRDTRKKEEAAETNKQEIARLRDELVEAKKKVEILGVEAKKLERPAFDDVRTNHWPEFEGAIRSLAKKAQETAEAEKRVRAIRNQAQAEIDEVTVIPYGGSRTFFTVFPPIVPLLLGPEGELPEYSPLSRFIRDCKDGGIVLDE